MMVEYLGEDGSQCLRWYHGTVQKVVNAKTYRVRIKGDEKCLGADDPRITDNKAMPDNWNPKMPKKGGWHHYLTK